MKRIDHEALLKAVSDATEILVIPHPYLDFLKPNVRIPRAPRRPQPPSMATTTVSKAVALRSATQLLPRSTPRGYKGRASLVYEMHSQLYPHLYGKSSNAKKPIADAAENTLEEVDEDRPSGSIWKQKKAKMEFVKKYSDEKLERASTYFSNHTSSR